MRILINFLNKNKFLVLLFALIAFVRIINVPELFAFGIDEEYQSLLGWSIVKDFHLIWIGLSAADTGFYVGPGLVYLHALLLYLSQGDPISLGYAAAFIGVITSGAIYFITKEIFGQKPAVLAMALYGFSSFLNIYDRKFWNPTFGPLISVLMFYSLYMAFKNERWWIAVAFLLGVIVHIHASLFVYFLIVPMLLLAYRKYAKSKLKISTIITSIVTFLIVYSPLIVYDLNKNFENLKTPLRLLAREGGGGGLQFDLLGQTLARLLFTQANTVSVAMVMILVVIVSFLIYRKKKEYQYALLYTLALIYMCLFLLFPGKILDYYLLGVIPLVMILLSLVLEKIPLVFLVPIILGYTFLNVSSFFKYPQTYGLAEKKVFIEKVMVEVKNKSFELRTPEPYVYHGGWRYLFQTYATTPVSSTADQMFSWIYPDEMSQPHAELLIDVNPINPPKEGYISKIIKGSYTAYVYEQ